MSCRFWYHLDPLLIPQWSHSFVLLPRSCWKRFRKNWWMDLLLFHCNYLDRCACAVHSVGRPKLARCLQRYQWWINLSNLGHYLLCYRYHPLCLFQVNEGSRLSECFRYARYCDCRADCSGNGCQGQAQSCQCAPWSCYLGSIPHCPQFHCL